MVNFKEIWDKRYQTCRISVEVNDAPVLQSLDGSKKFQPTIVVVNFARQGVQHWHLLSVEAAEIRNDEHIAANTYHNAKQLTGAPTWIQEIINQAYIALPLT